MQCLLLGKDSIEYGKVLQSDIDDCISMAVSVGADRHSPSLMFKGDSTFLNEDAALAIKQEQHLLMAVADSHFGYWASHAILEGLAKQQRRIDSPAVLFTVLQDMCGTQYDIRENSETTLLVLCMNMDSGQGFGVSFGDSSAVILNSDGYIPLNSKNDHYVTLNRFDSLTAAQADIFEFTVCREDLLVMFTDGVDECHYGHPKTSVQADHIASLYRNNHHCHDFVRALAELALRGVDGNPGGQDNIAIAAAKLC
ncbi:MAG: protein phosphatase 2C domain-containing protein [Gammaproteobacteria bacterium]|nr:protein phosphatase 2C domain-containing protein [Gammaproteobacteria bacterium]MDH5650433.1 protein phosphatase 2C domain-containing protein [Gammaproteobacteria bacterium]